MSKTAPVLKSLASEQSHVTMCATSSAVPSRFMGLSLIMPLTTSGPRSRIMSVSIGPGATQLTRMPASTTSRDSALLKREDATTGARISGNPGNSFLAGERRHVDDTAAAPAAHVGQQRLRDLHRADQVDCNNMLPVGWIVSFECGCRAEDSRIVD